MAVVEQSSSQAVVREGLADVVMENYSYDDKIARMFTLATVAWGLVAFLVGIFVALQLVLPQLNFGLQ